jgi:hypothetical protein
MPQFVVGGFFVAHGLITSVIGVTAVTNPNSPALALPSFFNWWPGPFGRSWLVDALQLGSGASMAGGVVWLVAGLALIGAGLGFLGVPGVRDAWQTLAFFGGAVGLLTLALYFHPVYLIAVLINVAIVALMWGRLGTAS